MTCFLGERLGVSPSAPKKHFDYFQGLQYDRAQEGLPRLNWLVRRGKSHEGQ